MNVLTLFTGGKVALIVAVVGIFLGTSMHALSAQPAYVTLAKHQTAQTK